MQRTAPILPMRPGLPEKATHDYIRHGTTTLFAALEVATGTVTDACMPRHRQPTVGVVLACAGERLRALATAYATTPAPTPS